ncbi:Thyrotropin-releasing hormone receptor [Orchesella cincta]|uniref:Thyrotropin-releasing hormone receptor n=1 Tax=Orchesella cincta TaxID=48709 RepID=A0A1D2M371_ORCCI|nr:Thyrotropin-releasing hormone receptor [Orchesella cincta]
MLAIVSGLFAILWLPYRGLLVYNSVAQEKFMNVWYLMASKSCIYLNSAFNPILYNAMSVKFRKEFKRALFLKSGKPSKHSNIKEKRLMLHFWL